MRGRVQRRESWGFQGGIDGEGELRRVPVPVKYSHGCIAESAKIEQAVTAKERKKKQEGKEEEKRGKRKSTGPRQEANEGLGNKKQAKQCYEANLRKETL